MLWLIPQNSLAGEVVVSGMKVMDPVNFEPVEIAMQLKVKVCSDIGL
jgi:hypothetical protein